MSDTAAPDMAVLEAMVGQIVGFMTGGAVCAGVVVGEELGFYRALARQGATTADALAGETGCHPRLVREWLDGQAAAGLVRYDAAADCYELGAEAAMILADEDSPAFLAGGVAMLQAMFDAIPRLEAAFKSDGGVAWGDHHPAMFSSVARFFRPGYRTNLVSEWIPALDGVEARLERGARIADVGCGFGHSCVVLAEAYPNSTVTGFDFHRPSIDAAEGNARMAGVADRVRFEAVGSTAYDGEFDLICFFDCLHDMGDPVGIARHAREHLAPGGTVLLVEPFALADRASNIAGNPAAALFYTASTFVCTPCSLSQDVGRAMGAQSGESGMQAVFAEAGYRQLRAAHTTPFNIVYEARA